MWNKYQQYADEQHGRVQSSQMPVVGQGIYPGAPYQEWADTFHTRTIDDSTARVPFAPVQAMAQGSQAGANRFPGRIRNAEQLALNGLGYWRRSGSMARAARVVGALGAEAPMDYQKTCANFDFDKWLAPVVAFIYGHPDFTKEKGATTKTTEDAAAQFGRTEMVCVMYGMATKKVDVAALGGQAGIEKLMAAGQKMHANGWWAKDDWYDYFKNWSGYYPWYKNPYYLGGGGAVLLAGTWLYLRKR